LKRNGFSIDRDLLGGKSAIAQLRDAALDGDAPCFDPAFDFPPGS